jgi:hypothetical protein
MKKEWVELFIMMKKENLFHKKKQWRLFNEQAEEEARKKKIKLWVEL